MERAWKSTGDAVRFAFGRQAGDMPRTAVLLHKDRLDDIERLLDASRRFQARWSCLCDESHSVAFIPTPAGASDVGDCLLHLAAADVQRVLFAGTCGSLSAGVGAGQVCVITEGWTADSVLAWVADETRAVSDAHHVDVGASPPVSQLQARLESDCNVQAQRIRSFTTALQAMESPRILRQMRELGAEVIDMETGVFLTVAKRCRFVCAAMLWCTDGLKPLTYYDLPSDSAIFAREQAWLQWPAILLAAGRGFAAPE